ncbi:kinase-interacting protein 1-like protein [Cinnamomum micranthum f. kanehirae]|uniref:Kinase-interacting protein 1-like protein n=1 Tax=Cinnamomum micranthum f. kanehirae TaxID=337451 RepID=A0A3S3PWE4_9MAGN|nr:kinase-interacting protein 1-like protein [Cinnamomum micranthum f. kanehirae]
MEEKVKAVLIVIEDDADSFAKRAEMFYKKRPELVRFVNEYRDAYTSLAERYCHLVKDLQTANRTIATAFPNQVQFSIEDDDDDEFLPKAASPKSIKIPRAFSESPKLNMEFSEPRKEIKAPAPSQPEKPQAQKPGPHKNKVEASPEELDKLQKEILALQTEMESVRNSYESGLAKYWEIEERITGMQDMVCNLQDEFSISTIIEDNEARSLVAVAALRSCQDTVDHLQEQQKRSAEEARVESQKVKDIKKKLKILKGGFLPDQTVPDELTIEESENPEEEVYGLKQENMDFQSICEKVKEYLEMDYNTPLTVTDLAEKIDELVNMILALQTTISSQNALIKRLRLDADRLQNLLQSLEQGEMNLTNDSKDLKEKMRELENELHGIQDLNHSVKDQNKKLQMGFTDVCHNLKDLYGKLDSGEKRDEDDDEDEDEDNNEDEDEIIGTEENDSFEDEPTEQCQEQEVMMTPANDSKDSEDPANDSKDSEDLANDSKDSEDPANDSKDSEDNMVEPDKETEGTKDHNLCVEDQENRNRTKSHVRRKFQSCSNLDAFCEFLQDPGNQDEVENTLPSQEEDNLDSPNWQQLLSNESEDKEKIILAEYTAALRNYKETKKKLYEIENEKRGTFFETMALVKELKSANAMKEKEIQSLRQKLSLLETIPDGNLHHGSVESVEDKSKSGVDNLRAKSLDGSNSDSLENLANEHNSDSKEIIDESSATASTQTPTGEEIEAALTVEPRIASSIEERFRKAVDEQLEENIQFWLRFGTSSQQIQKLQMETEDLHSQFSKLSSNSSDPSAKPEATPIINCLNKLQTELSEWLEENASLKEELQCRNSSLSKMQRVITRTSMMCYETEQVEFTVYEATKFQGEVLNMQQENNKVESDLQTGLDHVRALQSEVERILSKLQGDSKVTGSKNHPALNPASIPLESFIYGVKHKKHSKFSFMNPALQKQFRDLKAQLPK